MTRSFWTRAAVAAVLVAVALPAGAVTDEEIFRDLRFNFINPGGRALGMGGAFVSLADDATAAQANPAGLVRLARPEFFGEFRFASYDTVGTFQQVENTFNPDRITTTNTATDADSVANPSFLSYVIPFRRVALGFSRLELLNFESRATNRYSVVDGSQPAPDNSGFIESIGAVDLQVVNYNVSAGISLHRTFSVGATVTYSRLAQQSVVGNFITDLFPVSPEPDIRRFELWRTSADGSDDDVLFNAGFLWAPIESLSIGGVWRQGGDYTVENVLAADGDPSDSYGSLASVPFQAACDVTYTTGASCAFQNEFHLPDVYSLGVSWRPLPALTLALDAVQIDYSSLVEGFQPLLNAQNLFRAEEDARYTVDDQLNLAFGIEYVLRGGETPVSLRGGWHQDKDNRLRADFPGEAGNDFILSNNETFPGRDDLDHITLGVGAVFGKNFQFDAAVDYSKETVEAVASFIHRF